MSNDMVVADWRQRMSYDTKCAELAEAFLQDEPPVLVTAKNIHRISQRIQDCIEDEILCIKQDADDSVEAAKDAKWQALLDERRGK